MTHSKFVSVHFLSLILSALALAPLNVVAQEQAIPPPQPLGNLTKEEPEAKYVHLQDAKAKVGKFKEEGNIAKAIEAQRKSLKIAENEFSGNRLIVIEETLVLADLLHQQKESEEADQLLTNIDTLIKECTECPAPFLEGLQKRVDELRGEPATNE